MTLQWCSQVELGAEPLQLLLEQSWMWLPPGWGVRPWVKGLPGCRESPELNMRCQHPQQLETKCFSLRVGAGERASGHHLWPASHTPCSREARTQPQGDAELVFKTKITLFFFFKENETWRTSNSQRNLLLGFLLKFFVFLPSSSQMSFGLDVLFSVCAVTAAGEEPPGSPVVPTGACQVVSLK